MAPTTSAAQRAELHKTIWRIANDLRGSVDGWDFKTYVLGLLFYRFVSENLAAYLDKAEHAAGEADFEYAHLPDAEAEFGRADTVAEKGFYILPSDLFQNVRERAPRDANLNETLARVFKNIEASAIGTTSEDAVKGLFDDLDVNSSKLGGTVAKRNEKLVKLLDAIGDLPLGNFEDNTIDLFGDAYEYLMQMYASQAGKSGGEYYTPQEVSEVLAKITVQGKTKVNKVYDPAAGSGSLLLKFAKVLGRENVGGFFGQEINLTTYNLARINMFLHDVNYEKFSMAHGDTLLDPQHWDDEPFEAIVSNPPYSIRWEGDANPLLINDERFAPAGVLAPKSKADLAFTMHILSWLAVNGTAAIVEFPGVLYRGGAEQKIRKYLIDNNYVDAVIQLPPDLFFGTTIATCIIVLKKSKPDDAVLFIDASAEFKRVGNKNKLTTENQQHIIDTLNARMDVKHVARLVTNESIDTNAYNIAVSAYVEMMDARGIVDIAKINAEVANIVVHQAELRISIDEIVADLEEAPRQHDTRLKRVLLGGHLEMRRMKIIDLFDLRAGKFIAASEIVARPDDEHSVPCYGGGGLRGYVATANQSGERVLIGRQGALCGNINRASGDFYATEHSVVVAPRGDTDIRWTFHMLASMNLNQYASKSAQPGLAVGTLNQLQIDVPRVEEQARIGAILDKLDEITNDPITGLVAELAARRKQYEYYRDKLLTFEEAPE